MKKLNRRKWLNSINSNHTGSISYSVETNISEHDTGIDTTFIIRDCSRSISLDFGVYSYSKNGHSLKKKDLNNALNKIRILKESIEEFEEKYLEAIKEIENHECR